MAKLFGLYCVKFGNPTSITNDQWTLSRHMNILCVYGYPPQLSTCNQITKENADISLVYWRMQTDFTYVQVDQD